MNGDLDEQLKTIIQIEFEKWRTDVLPMEALKQSIKKQTSNLLMKTKISGNGFIDFITASNYFGRPLSVWPDVRWYPEGDKINKENSEEIRHETESFLIPIIFNFMLQMFNILQRERELPIKFLELILANQFTDNLLRQFLSPIEKHFRSVNYLYNVENNFVTLVSERNLVKIIFEINTLLRDFNRPTYFEGSLGYYMNLPILHEIFVNHLLTNLQADRIQFNFLCKQDNFLSFIKRYPSVFRYEGEKIRSICPMLKFDPGFPLDPVPIRNAFEEWKQNMFSPNHDTNFGFHSHRALFSHADHPPSMVPVTPMSVPFYPLQPIPNRHNIGMADVSNGSAFTPISTRNVPFPLVQPTPKRHNPKPMTDVSNEFAFMQNDEVPTDCRPLSPKMPPSPSAAVSKIDHQAVLYDISLNSTSSDNKQSIIQPPKMCLQKKNIIDMSAFELNLLSSDLNGNGNHLKNTENTSTNIPSKMDLNNEAPRRSILRQTLGSNKSESCETSSYVSAFQPKIAAKPVLSRSKSTANVSFSLLETENISPKMVWDYNDIPKNLPKPLKPSKSPEK